MNENRRDSLFMHAPREEISIHTSSYRSDALPLFIPCRPSLSFHFSFCATLRGGAYDITAPVVRIVIESSEGT